MLLLWYCPSFRFRPSMLEFLPNGDQLRYCSFKIEIWTLNLSFFFFFSSRWKMTLLLAITMQSCYLGMFWRNLSPLRDPCYLSVSSMNSEIPHLKVKMTSHEQGSLNWRKERNLFLSTLRISPCYFKKVQDLQWVLFPLLFFFLSFFFFFFFLIIFFSNMLSSVLTKALHNSHVQNYLSACNIQEAESWNDKNL